MREDASCKGGLSRGRGARCEGPGSIVGGAAAAAIVGGAGDHHHQHSWESGARVAVPKWTHPIKTFISKESFFGLRLVGRIFRGTKPKIKALRAKAIIN